MKANKKSKIKPTIISKISTFFFTQSRAAIIILLLILIGGGSIYSTRIKREGFPPIQFPLSFVSGAYFVNDINAVDDQIAKPFYSAVKQIDGVKEVRTTANANDFSAVVYFDDGVVASEGTENIRNAIKDVLPETAMVNVISIDPSAFLNKYDLLLTVYGAGSDVKALEEVASFVANDITKIPEVVLAEPLPLTTTAVNPNTQQEQSSQTSFNKVGIPTDSGLIFENAVTVGVDRDSSKYDVIELSESVNEYLKSLDLSQFGSGFNVMIGADFAESINTQISSLESNLLTGLIAVAIISLLLISWRASIITAIFMITVMALTVSILYFVGYTLNTITLFALVLSLGLFVDDATIVVEAIDAAKKKRKKPKKIISEAISKIGAASFAGTFTTVLVFLPLAFITGILGEFIRLMPITVIIALLSSLLLSLTLIPVLAKYLMLRSDKVSFFTKINPIAKLEEWISIKIGEAPRLLKTNKRLGMVFGVIAISLSLFGLVGAGYFAQKLQFNIFPPSKDSDQIGIAMQFPSGYTIDDAIETSSIVDEVIDEEVGPLVKRITYGSFSIVQPNARSADILIELVPFNQRDTKSPEIIATLEDRLDLAIEDETRISVSQFDSGPPSEDFPFKVQIFNEDPVIASAISAEIVEFLDDAKIERTNGTEAKITEVTASRAQNVTRKDNNRFLQITASFDADDTSALLTATESLVKDKFTEEYLSNQGYENTEITYDFGQESENAESFSALGVIFPIALGLMYILLAMQFRSLLQPLLIFLAIPFTFLGVFLGLYITDNSISFFVMVGLIGLIGIAVNNTILLTTYANQERKIGSDRIDAISTAVTKRFRPLLATTVTTIVALLPLALSDPFWEALAFTIIFGLASSTFFVLISFPYYYIAFDRLARSQIVKLIALWLIGLIVLVVVIGQNRSYVLSVVLIYIAATLIFKEQWKKIGK